MNLSGLIPMREERKVGEYLTVDCRSDNVRFAMRACVLTLGLDRLKALCVRNGSTGASTRLYDPMALMTS